MMTVRAADLRRGRSPLCDIVDLMGAASAKAQGLGAVITTADKLKASDHRVYLIADRASRSALGLIKVGVKKLFIRVRPPPPPLRPTAASPPESWLREVGEALP